MTKHRPLSAIAQEIFASIRRDEWKGASKAYAMPYLRAMAELDQITDRYYNDSAKSVVLYFLSNAQSWKGETARKIKAELRSLVK